MSTRVANRGLSLVNGTRGKSDFRKSAVAVAVSRAVQYRIDIVEHVLRPEGLLQVAEAIGNEFELPGSEPTSSDEALGR